MLKSLEAEVCPSLSCDFTVIEFKLTCICFADASLTSVQGFMSRNSTCASPSFQKTYSCEMTSAVSNILPITWFLVTMPHSLRQ